MKAESIENLKQLMISTFKNFGDKTILISKKSYTGNEIAKEIEDETEVGIHFMDNMIQLTIDLLKRDKINLKV